MSDFRVDDDQLSIAFKGSGYAADRVAGLALLAAGLVLTRLLDLAT